MVQTIKAHCPNCGEAFTAKPRRATKTARGKGQRGELEAARELIRLINQYAPDLFVDPPLALGSHKGDQWDFRRSAASGGRFDRGDLVKSDRLTKVFRYHLEIKNAENWSFDELFNNGIPLLWRNAIRQATDDCPDGETPIVIVKRNRTPFYVVCRYEDPVIQRVLEKQLDPVAMFWNPVMGDEGWYVVTSLDQFMHAWSQAR